METTTTTKTKEIFTPEEFDGETSELGPVSMAAIAFACANVLIERTVVTKETMRRMFTFVREKYER